MSVNLCPKCMEKLAAHIAVCPKCGPISQQASDVLPRKIVLKQRYTVGDVIGSGGFGTTYIGLDNTLESKVAIKEYLPYGCAKRDNDGVTITPYDDRKDEYQKRLSDFLTEAKRLAALEKYSGIVGVKDFFIENGTGYMVMPYLDGKTLKEHVIERGGSLLWGELSEIFIPVLESLALVHSEGIIHRDISPDNIYLPREGRPLLIDFGAAAESTGDFTLAHDQIYKDGYAPPEQYQTKSRQGPWTDIYALAGTIYYGLTGKKPPRCFDRVDGDDDIKSDLLKVIDGRKINVLLKALHLDSKQRYRTINEFKHDLFDSSTLGAIAGQSKLKYFGIYIFFIITLFLLIPPLYRYVDSIYPNVPGIQSTFGSQESSLALKELVSVTLDHAKQAGWHHSRAEKIRVLLAKMEDFKNYDVTSQIEIQKNKLRDNEVGFERDFQYYIENAEKIREHSATSIQSALDDAMSDHPSDPAYIEFSMMAKSQLLGTSLDVNSWKEEIKKISLKPGVFVN